MRKKRSKAAAKPDPNEEAFQVGRAIAFSNPLVGSLLANLRIYRHEQFHTGKAWVVAHQAGVVYVNPKLKAEPAEWAYVLAHAALHYGFGHFEEVPRENEAAWQASCDCAASHFLSDIKLGQRPAHPFYEVPRGNPDSLYRRFCENVIPNELVEIGTLAPMSREMKTWDWMSKTNWSRVMAEGIARSVDEAVEIASGIVAQSPRISANLQKSRSWFVTYYPLLGALATTFDLIEDVSICRRLDIEVAAVDPYAQIIYFNPAKYLDSEELKFVMAHELLHVGLRHLERREGRDPYLWNVACDFVINQWLVEMKVGRIPEVGVLLEPEFKGLSAEEVYDRIVRDLRRFRKLSTLRGIGLGDILGEPARGAKATNLDDFYRSCLAQGLEVHIRNGRGLLPADMVEEIRSLSQPPIPWDVQLAQWLDGYFQPLQQHRTYARASRRQSASPDIPRPRWVRDEEEVRARTFGVVLDTSGSMDRQLLGKGLGAIASYAASREVPKIRLVFCDAHPYDEGYVAADDVAGRVRVRGRGGTILQPGIDLLEHAEDFPPSGPILIITDAWCDVVTCRRDHAYLTPIGAQLPFLPKGPVFRIC